MNKPIVAKTGLDRGNTIRKKIVKSLAPSILAASSKVSGIPLKKLVITKILNALIALGKIKAHSVFIIPNSFISK